MKEVILNSEEYFKSLLHDIAEAKETIDLETYIFNHDDFSKKISEQLAIASKKGVKIRLLLDGIGTESWSDFLDHLVQSGVEVRIFHPVPWRWWQVPFSNLKESFLNKIIYFFSKLNKRNHRKTCIIDHKIVYVGSVNIFQKQLNWEEDVVRLEDIPIQDLEYVFNTAWHGFPIPKTTREYFRKKADTTIFRLNFTRFLRRRLYADLLKKIAAAEKNIWITNAYFNPDYYLLSRLRQASKRNGIDVKILIPKLSDAPLLPMVAKTFYYQLLKANIKVYEYQPRILHAKVFIIDNWFCIGSSNLNYRSLIHDLEIDVEIQTPENHDFLRKQFEERLKESRRISFTDIKNFPLYQRILGRMLLFIKYFL